MWVLRANSFRDPLVSPWERQYPQSRGVQTGAFGHLRRLRRVAIASQGLAAAHKVKEASTHKYGWFFLVFPKRGWFPPSTQKIQPNLWVEASLNVTKVYMCWHIFSVFLFLFQTVNFCWKHTINSNIRSGVASLTSIAKVSQISGSWSWLLCFPTSARTKESLS